MPRVKFGSFELDPFTGELWHGNVHTHLQEQPLQVLICLLERQGKVVTREQLRERVWGNAIHVNYEDGLNTAVSKLRQALEENADHPVLIETLPRKGYRFTARAVEEASGQMPALRALTGLRSGPEGELVQVAPSAPPATGPPTDPRPRFRAATLRRPGWMSGLLGLGLLTSGLGAWFWLRRGPTAVPPVVAVLPVEGKGAEGAGEGVLQVALQSLHAELGRSRGVRLISMGSARRAREEGLPLQAFARRLQADSVLEAAMQPAAGGQMVFTVNWVDGATGRVLGSDRLQGPASEGAELGLQMSRRVARRLNLELAPAPRTPLPSEEVRTYLLAGQRAFEQGGAEGLRRAEELYRKAIVLDPGSSEAHAGLSELLQSRCFGPWDSLDPLLVAPEAEREARRAVEGDPGSARAHLLLGECLLYFRGDAREGEREITKGIALAPGSPAALQSQAWLDLIHRRWEPAVGGFEQALRLNPLSCFAFDDLCRAQFYAGRDAETLELVRRGLELGPEMAFLLRWKARSEARQGQLDAAFHSYLGWMTAMPGVGADPIRLKADLSAAYRRGGYQEALKAMAHRLEAEARRTYISPFDIALFHAEAQDAEASLAWLERGLGKGDPNMVLIRCCPGFDFLRWDLRFRAMAEQVHRGGDHG